MDDVSNGSPTKTVINKYQPRYRGQIGTTLSEDMLAWIELCRILAEPFLKYSSARIQ